MTNPDPRMAGQSATLSEYADAAMVACPRCPAKVGDPCTVRSVYRNGFSQYTYTVLRAPHLARVVAARTTPTRHEADATGGAL